MDLKDLRQYFSDELLDRVDVNPAELASEQEFRRPEPSRYLSKPGPDYRERAIQLLADMQLPFSVTINLYYELAKRCIKVACFYCQTEMTVANGWSGGRHFHVDYHCPNCRATVTIGGEEHSWSFTPFGEPHVQAHTQD